MAKGLRKKEKPEEQTDPREGREESTEEKQISGLLLDIFALLIKIGWILTIFAVSLLLVIGITVNRGTRMAPSFQERDLVFFYRLGKNFSADDVVVYVNEQGKLLLGRVIATGGDTVDVTSEGVKINGYYTTDPHAVGETVLFEDGASFPITLREGEYFVLCDDRSEGDDSRWLGPLSRDEIKGRVMLSIRQRDF